MPMMSNGKSNNTSARPTAKGSARNGSRSFDTAIEAV